MDEIRRVPTDIQSNIIKVGDAVAYASTSGKRAYMNNLIVTAISGMRVTMGSRNTTFSNRNILIINK